MHLLVCYLNIECIRSFVRHPKERHSFGRPIRKLKCSADKSRNERLLKNAGCCFVVPVMDNCRTVVEMALDFYSPNFSKYP